MESLSISSRSPLLRHPAIRRIDLAVAGRRLHFPRPSVPRYHTVRCSHAAPPPKERDGNKKSRWKAAAAGTAAAVAFALGAVYLSRAAPVSPAKPPGTEPETQVPENTRDCCNIVIEDDSDEKEYEDDDESPENNQVLGTMRDEVREILFKKGTCGVPNLIESWMNEQMRFDAALMVVQWHIAKKDYHAAEEICKKTIEKGSEADARPHLLMAVIKMMLAVEAMLKPETGEKDPEVYVKSAMDSWKAFHESVGREIPNC